MEPCIRVGAVSACDGVVLHHIYTQTLSFCVQGLYFLKLPHPASCLSTTFNFSASGRLQHISHTATKWERNDTVSLSPFRWMRIIYDYSVSSISTSHQNQAKTGSATLNVVKGLWCLGRWPGAPLLAQKSLLCINHPSQILVNHDPARAMRPSPRSILNSDLLHVTFSADNLPGVTDWGEGHLHACGLKFLLAPPYIKRMPPLYV